MGYILVDQEVKTNTKQKTGTLLDRFDSKNTDHTETSLSVSESPLPVVNKKFLSLSPNVSSFAFSPDNTKVVYFVYQKNKNGESGTVFISESDGSNPQILLKTRVPTIALSWAGENEIAIEIDPLKEPIVLSIKKSE